MVFLKMRDPFPAMAFHWLVLALVFTSSYSQWTSYSHRSPNVDKLWHPNMPAPRVLRAPGKSTSSRSIKGMPEPAPPHNQHHQQQYQNQRYKAVDNRERDRDRNINYRLTIDLKNNPHSNSNNQPSQRSESPSLLHHGSSRQSSSNNYDSGRISQRSSSGAGNSHSHPSAPVSNSNRHSSPPQSIRDSRDRDSHSRDREPSRQENRNSQFSSRSGPVQSWRNPSNSQKEAPQSSHSSGPTNRQIPQNSHPHPHPPNSRMNWQNPQGNSNNNNNNINVNRGNDIRISIDRRMLNVDRQPSPRGEPTRRPVSQQGGHLYDSWPNSNTHHHLAPVLPNAKSNRPVSHANQETQHWGGNSKHSNNQNHNNKEHNTKSNVRISNSGVEVHTNSNSRSSVRVTPAAPSPSPSYSKHNNKPRVLTSQQKEKAVSNTLNTLAKLSPKQPIFVFMRNEGISAVKAGTDAGEVIKKLAGSSKLPFYNGTGSLPPNNIPTVFLAPEDMSAPYGYGKIPIPNISKSKSSSASSHALSSSASSLAMSLSPLSSSSPPTSPAPSYTQVLLPGGKTVLSKLKPHQHSFTTMNQTTDVLSLEQKLRILQLIKNQAAQDMAKAGPGTNTNYMTNYKIIQAPPGAGAPDAQTLLNGLLPQGAVLESILPMGAGARGDPLSAAAAYPVPNLLSNSLGHIPGVIDPALGRPQFSEFQQQQKQSFNPFVFSSTTTPRPSVLQPQGIPPGKLEESEFQKILGAIVDSVVPKAPSLFTPSPLFPTGMQPTPVPWDPQWNGNQQGGHQSSNPFASSQSQNQPNTPQQPNNQYQNQNQPQPFGQQQNYPQGQQQGQFQGPPQHQQGQFKRPQQQQQGQFQGPPQQQQQGQFQGPQQQQQGQFQGPPQQQQQGQFQGPQQQQQGQFQGPQQQQQGQFQGPQQQQQGQFQGPQQQQQGQFQGPQQQQQGQFQGPQQQQQGQFQGPQQQQQGQFQRPQQQQGQFQGPQQQQGQFQGTQQQQGQFQGPSQQQQGQHQGPSQQQQGQFQGRPQQGQFQGPHQQTQGQFQGPHGPPQQWNQNGAHGPHPMDQSQQQSHKEGGTGILIPSPPPTPPPAPPAPPTPAPVKIPVMAIGKINRPKPPRPLPPQQSRSPLKTALSFFGLQQSTSRPDLAAMHNLPQYPMRVRPQVHPKAQPRPEPEPTPPVRRPPPPPPPETDDSISSESTIYETAHKPSSSSGHSTIILQAPQQSSSDKQGNKQKSPTIVIHGDGSHLPELKKIMKVLNEINNEEKENATPPPPPPPMYRGPPSYPSSPWPTRRPTISPFGPIRTPPQPPQQFPPQQNQQFQGNQNTAGMPSLSMSPPVPLMPPTSRPASYVSSTPTYLQQSSSRPFASPTPNNVLVAPTPSPPILIQNQPQRPPVIQLSNPTASPPQQIYIQSSTPLPQFVSLSPPVNPNTVQNVLKQQPLVFGSTPRPTIIHHSASASPVMSSTPRYMVSNQAPNQYSPVVIKQFSPTPSLQTISANPTNSGPGVGNTAFQIISAVENTAPTRTLSHSKNVTPKENLVSNESRYSKESEEKNQRQYGKEGSYEKSHRDYHRGGSSEHNHREYHKDTSSEKKHKDYHRDGGSEKSHRDYHRDESSEKSQRDHYHRGSSQEKEHPRYSKEDSREEKDSHRYNKDSREENVHQRYNKDDRDERDRHRYSKDSREEKDQRYSKDSREEKDEHRYSKESKEKHQPKDESSEEKLIEKVITEEKIVWKEGPSNADGSPSKMIPQKIRTEERIIVRPHGSKSSSDRDRERVDSQERSQSKSRPTAVTKQVSQDSATSESAQRVRTENINIGQSSGSAESSQTSPQLQELLKAFQSQSSESYERFFYPSRYNNFNPSSNNKQIADPPKSNELQEEVRSEEKTPLENATTFAGLLMSKIRFEKLKEKMYPAAHNPWAPANNSVSANFVKYATSPTELTSSPTLPSIPSTIYSNLLSSSVPDNGRYKIRPGDISKSEDNSPLAFFSPSVSSPTVLQQVSETQNYNGVYGISPSSQSMLGEYSSSSASYNQDGVSPTSPSQNYNIPYGISPTGQSLLVATPSSASPSSSSIPQSQNQNYNNGQYGVSASGQPMFLVTSTPSPYAQTGTPSSVTPSQTFNSQYGGSLSGQSILGALPSSSPPSVQSLLISGSQNYNSQYANSPSGQPLSPSLVSPSLQSQSQGYNLQYGVSSNGQSIQMPSPSSPPASSSLLSGSQNYNTQYGNNAGGQPIMPAFPTSPAPAASPSLQATYQNYNSQYGSIGTSGNGQSLLISPPSDSPSLPLGSQNFNNAQYGISSTGQQILIPSPALSTSPLSQAQSQNYNGQYSKLPGGQPVGTNAASSSYIQSGGALPSPYVYSTASQNSGSVYNPQAASGSSTMDEQLIFVPSNSNSPTGGFSNNNEEVKLFYPSSTRAPQTLLDLATGQRQPILYSSANSVPDLMAQIGATPEQLRIISETPMWQPGHQAINGGQYSVEGVQLDNPTSSAAPIVLITNATTTSSTTTTNSTTTVPTTTTVNSTSETVNTTVPSYISPGQSSFFRPPEQGGDNRRMDEIDEDEYLSNINGTDESVNDTSKQLSLANGINSDLLEAMTASPLPFWDRKTAHRPSNDVGGPVLYTMTNGVPVPFNGRMPYHPLFVQSQSPTGETKDPMLAYYPWKWSEMDQEYQSTEPTPSKQPDVKAKYRSRYRVGPTASDQDPHQLIPVYIQKHRRNRHRVKLTTTSSTTKAYPDEDTGDYEDDLVNDDVAGSVHHPRNRNIPRKHRPIADEDTEYDVADDEDKEIKISNKRRPGSSRVQSRDDIEDEEHEQRKKKVTITTKGRRNRPQKIHSDEEIEDDPIERRRPVRRKGTTAAPSPYYEGPEMSEDTEEIKPKDERITKKERKSSRDKDAVEEDYDDYDLKPDFHTHYKHKSRKSASASSRRNRHSDEQEEEQDKKSKARDSGEGKQHRDSHKPGHINRDMFLVSSEDKEDDRRAEIISAEDKDPFRASPVYEPKKLHSMSLMKESKDSPSIISGTSVVKKTGSTATYDDYDYVRPLPKRTTPTTTSTTSTTTTTTTTTTERPSTTASTTRLTRPSTIVTKIRIVPTKPVPVATTTAKKLTTSAVPNSMENDYFGDTHDELKSLLKKLQTRLQAKEFNYDTDSSLAYDYYDQSELTVPSTKATTTTTSRKPPKPKTKRPSSTTTKKPKSNKKNKKNKKGTTPRPTTKKPKTTKAPKTTVRTTRRPTVKTIVTKKPSLKTTVKTTTTKAPTTTKKVMIKKNNILDRLRHNRHPESSLETYASSSSTTTTTSTTTEAPSSTITTTTMIAAQPDVQSTAEEAGSGSVEKQSRNSQSDEGEQHQIESVVSSVSSVSSVVTQEDDQQPEYNPAPPQSETPTVSTGVSYVFPHNPEMDGNSENATVSNIPRIPGKVPMRKRPLWVRRRFSGELQPTGVTGAHGERKVIRLVRRRRPGVIGHQRRPTFVHSDEQNSNTLTDQAGSANSQNAQTTPETTVLPIENLFDQNIARRVGIADSNEATNQTHRTGKRKLRLIRLKGQRAQWKLRLNGGEEGQRSDEPRAESIIAPRSGEMFYPSVSPSVSFSSSLVSASQNIQPQQSQVPNQPPRLDTTNASIETKVCVRGRCEVVTKQ